MTAAMVLMPWQEDASRMVVGSNLHLSKNFFLRKFMLVTYKLLVVELTHF